MTIDTKAIKADYPLKDFISSRYGRKFEGTKCECLFHDDKNASMSVSRAPDGTDRWKCHACDIRGDIFELVALAHKLDKSKDFAEICRIITGESHATSRPDPKPQVEEAPKAAPTRTWEPIPAPKHAGFGSGKDASALTANGKTMTKPGRIVQLVHKYRDTQGKVILIAVRYETPPKVKGGKPGKDVMPIRYIDGQLRWKGFSGDSELSPLYGLDRLAAHPRMPVLVVEGEKCVDLLQPLMEDKYVVVTWQGGAGGWAKADWQALWERDVTLWEDYDHRPRKDGVVTSEKRAGHEYMVGIAEILRQKQVGRLKLVDLSDYTEETHKHGYDVADMLLEGKTAPEILSFLKSRAKPMQPKAALVESNPYTTDWLPQGVEMIVSTSSQQIKRDDSSNSWLVLNYHPKFKGRFTYDVFDQVALVDGEPLTEAKLQNLRLEMTQRTQLLPKGQELQKQVEALALLNKTNRFADQLRSLVWDGVPRLAPSSLHDEPQGLLIEYANCQNTPLNRVLGMRWLVGAVQRVLQDPNTDEGFQHDGMLVLEGEQGLGKTSFLRKLGSLFGRPLYTELQGSLGKDKDDMLKLRGKCIVELAEMTAHRRSEEGSFKAFIDRKVDEYRPPYGAGMVRQPRMVVFAGTTNQQAYLTDPTGNRRIWPALVEREIDTRKLERDLEQIWAEAVWLAQGGERNHLLGDELVWHAEVISGRDAIESWDEYLEAHGFFEMWPRDGWTTDEILDEHLKIPLKDRTKGMEQRVKDILTKRGYHIAQGSATAKGQTRRRSWRVKHR